MGRGFVIGILAQARRLKAFLPLEQEREGACLAWAVNSKLLIMKDFLPKEQTSTPN